MILEQFHNDYKKYLSPGSICGYLGVSPNPRGAIQNAYRSTLEGIVLVTDVLINVDDVVEDWCDDVVDDVVENLLNENKTALLTSPSALRVPKSASMIYRTA